MPERKPLAPMESLEARTIRGERALWQAIDAGARARGVEAAVFARSVMLMGIMMTRNPLLMEASVQVLSGIHLAGFERPESLSSDLTEQRVQIHENAQRHRELVNEHRRHMDKTKELAGRLAAAKGIGK